MRKFVKPMSKACGPMVHVTKFDARGRKYLTHEVIYVSNIYVVFLFSLS